MNGVPEMMTETGRVVALEANAVWVETMRTSTCGSCEVRSGCGHGLLASIGRSSSLVRALLTSGGPADLEVHDEVRISIPELGFLRGVAALYVMPLLSTLAAAVLASHVLVVDGMTQSQADLRVSLAAVAGLVLGLLILRGLGSRDATDVALNPVVTERL